jgi:hypothetical protein
MSAALRKKILNKWQTRASSYSGHTQEIPFAVCVEIANVAAFLRLKCQIQLRGHIKDNEHNFQR